MLFGAGMVVMASRQEKARRPPWRLHMRRMFVLLLFGLAHGWLMWDGDILYSYALCGLAVFSFRRLAPWKLLLLGVVLLGIGTTISVSLWTSADVRRFLQSDNKPSQEEVEREVAAYRGSWRQQNEYRWPATRFTQTKLFVLLLFWRAAGLMLIGMALFRWHVLDASRSRAFYGAGIAIAILLGLPVIAWGIHCTEASGWDPAYSLLLVSQFNYWASLPVALGWVSLVMLAYQSSRLRPALRPFAAVGQTALSNYVLQTLLCSSLFYGHGLGWFGQVQRVGQMGVVGAVWLVQLVASPLWLRYFRFGPAEWLWRSLTYLTWQPFRKPAAP
jgi:uncharacterized protein